MTSEIEDLQARLAFQEQTLSELDDLVARQSGQIERLEQQLQALADRYRDLRQQLDQGEGPGPLDERPPHY